MIVCNHRNHDIPLHSHIVTKLNGIAHLKFVYTECVACTENDAIITGKRCELTSSCEHSKAAFLAISLLYELGQERLAQ